MILRAFLVTMISVNIIQWWESRGKVKKLEQELKETSSSCTTRDVLRLVSKLGEVRADRDASRDMVFIWSLFLIIYHPLN